MTTPSNRMAPGLSSDGQPHSHPPCPGFSPFDYRADGPVVIPFGYRAGGA